MLENAASISGNGPFLVRNLDSTWPRRVMFLSPATGLAGYRDLTGEEGDQVTIRLDRVASIAGRVVDCAGTAVAGADISLVYDDSQQKPHIGFPNGKWVPTREEILRDQRVHPEAELCWPVNIVAMRARARTADFSSRMSFLGCDATFRSSCRMRATSG